MKFLILFIIYIFFMYIILNISLYKLFSKEKLKPYFAIIPFLNIYYYLKICKIPFWTFFVPFLNLFVLFLSPYNLSREYGCKSITCVMAIIFPYIFLPYISFSKKMNINISYEAKYLKNQKDIDELEENLKIDSQKDFIFNEDLIDYQKQQTDTEIDTMINKIDNSGYQEDIYYDEQSFIDDNVNTPNSENSNSDFEILDDDSKIIPERLNTSNIDSLEDYIISEAQQEKDLSSNYKEYEAVAPSTEAIAFGGEQQIENTYSSQAKNDELKCPRCGSSLVGAKGICPGCGMQI